MVFEKGAGPVEFVVVFEYGPELEPDCKQAMLKPSKNLPAIEAAGIVLLYATIVSMAHWSCTSDHHFVVDAMQAVVQRSVTSSVVQR